MRIAVIVTTYNWPQALAAVLRSLGGQTYRDFEILVADDGSAAETANSIAKAVVTTSVRVRHIWQEDRGFRAAEARNRAVAATDADYLVFLDGDCLVRADFLQQHARLAEHGRFIAGNRILLSQSLSEQILQQGIRAELWGPLKWTAQRLQGRVNRLLSLARLSAGGWRDRQPQRWQGVKTCNLGLWRDDFLSVNGFNEKYQGWGYEDSDLAIRLLRNGVQRRDGRLATTGLDLWHNEHERQGTETNLARLHALERGDGAIQAELGVDRHRQQGGSEADT